MVDPVILSIFVVYFIIVIGLGYYASRKTTGMTDFIVAGRSMGPFLVAFSSCATIASGFFFVGLPGLCYNLGYQPFFAIPALNAILAYVIVYGLLAKPMRYLSEKHGALTIPDLFYTLYEDKRVRWFCSLIILIGIFCYMVSQWAAMGLLFQTLLKSTYMTGLIVGVVVVAAYCTMGGQTGNIYNDAFQMLVMCFGGILVILFGFQHVGGFTQMNLTLAKVSPEILLPFSTKGVGFTGWTFLSFFLLYAVGTVGQPQFTTRFYTIKKVDMLRWAPFIAAVCYVFITFFLFSGMIYRAAVVQGIAPKLTNPDMAVSEFLVRFMNPGMAGMVLAAAVAAIMSTVSTFIVVAASTVTRDIIEQGFGTQLTEKQGLHWSRVATIALCVITVLIAIKPPDLVAWLGNAAFGFFAAGLGPALVAGLRWRRANKYGALFSMIGGGGLALLLYFLKLFKVYVPKLDTGAIAFLVSIAVMIIVSLVTPYQHRSALPQPKKQSIQGSVSVAD
ncbi:MAG: sodium/proline symporter [Bacillota bacterium]|jgi:sodium/proline symporter|nr:sodium:proline symporter [Peptococcaceae bacterium]